DFRNEAHPSDFFFFRAEDGIRDRDVTGVQTCALPICMRKEEVPGGTSSFAAGMLYDVPISVVLTALPRVSARESRERDALVVARHVRRRSGGGGRRGGLGGVGGIGLGLDGRRLLCRGLIDL